MKRRFTYQLEGLKRDVAERMVMDAAGMAFPCPMCKGPTLEVEDMVRFRRCHSCAWASFGVPRVGLGA